MNALAPTFRTRSHYSPDDSYSLLPFRFLRLDDERQILTNFAGQHLVVSDETLRSLVDKTLPFDDPSFSDLESFHVLSVGSPEAHMELLAAQIRTRQSRLPDLATLHMFVVTLRCDHSCSYCQVSRVSEDRNAFDMTEEAANRAISIMFEGPSKYLKVEFQGGEPLLNFPLVRHIVTRVEERRLDRDVAFVVATNLSFLTDEMLGFFAEHQVAISTSIDGPPTLHNRNRPRPGKDAFERTISGIVRCREKLGPSSVSALMTCSPESLDQPEAIIDEYARQGFREIFLRHINPYGFAVRSAARMSYEADKFLDFYRRGLTHIIKLNQTGVPFREVYASIVLRRMITAYATGYVDLQSPTGAGLGALVYNYNGDVYASDEGRMLAEMGDTTFRLGNVHKNTWNDLFLESPILDIAYRTMAEGVPQCSDCAFQPWCGSNPVFHHATQGDMVGHRPSSAFCQRNMGIMKLLIHLLEDDPESARILRNWVR